MEKDAYGLLEYLSDPRANCFRGDRLGSVAEALAYMERKPEEMLRYAVCLKKDDRIIGEMFALPENGDTYSVGWHFNRHFEGKVMPVKLQRHSLSSFSRKGTHGAFTAM